MYITLYSAAVLEIKLFLFPDLPEYFRILSDNSYIFFLLITNMAVAKVLTKFQECF